uniref:Peptidase C39-like domain-containing protein n=1 Tax=candidate division WWE3 bacterium TaxID=2053526 RepID=A0A831YZ99_UNCKA
MAKNARVFLPPEMANVYERHEKLGINRVTSLKRHHEKSRRYRQRHSPKRFRLKKIAHLPGVAVWIVDGTAIRREVDVDFTMGGHGYRYLYVPLDEIWIDRANAHSDDLRPTIWHEYFERILMRNYRFSYELAHKLACRLEITLRNGKTFVLPVGTYRQETGFCGPATLKIYLSYLGRNLSEKYLARLCKTTAEKGTDPVEIVTTARKLGFRVRHRGRPLTEREIRRYCRMAQPERNPRRELIDKVKKQAAGVKVRKAWTVKTVKESIRKGRPILANIQVNREYGNGHYVLIIGFAKDRFVLSDPGDDRGYREVPIPEFMELWYELEDGTVHEGFAIDV